MNPGSPLKLASQKLREGNPGGNKSRAELEREAAQEVKYEALTEIPEPPEHLNSAAKAEWNDVCGALIERGVLASGMLAVIAHMCYAHAYIQKMETLDAPPNAALLGQLRLMYESFGLTPRSVGNTKSINGAKKENKLAKYLKPA